MLLRYIEQLVEVYWYKTKLSASSGNIYVSILFLSLFSQLLNDVCERTRDKKVIPFIQLQGFNCSGQVVCTKSLTDLPSGELTDWLPN